MTALHRYLAYGIPAGWLAMAVWAAISFVRNKAPGDGFWKLLAVMQVVLAIQVVVGGVLFALGMRPAAAGPQWLHYAYGGLFPIALLFAAHRYARRHESLSWVVFGTAALVIFGLTFRALQTGVGTL